MNWKWSVGKPLATRELITEVAPGNGIIFIFKLIKSFISLNPGSEINGVPASDIIPPEDSFFSKLIIFFLSLSEDLSLYMMIFSGFIPYFFRIILAFSLFSTIRRSNSLKT